MPIAHNGRIEIEYERIGSDGGVPLLLIMGLGAQMLSWDDELCEMFVEQGFEVARFDNRDVGKSTWFDDHPVDMNEEAARFLNGEPITAPYGIGDMADDAAAVLDALGWPSAHIMGASMGGMIAQAFAIKFPDRTRSLVSIMSTTGDLDVGQPDDEVLLSLLLPVPEGREAAIEAGVETGRIIGSPEHFNEARSRAITAAEYDRGFHPEGTVRQLLAILSTPSRSDGLRALDIPSLVIHGKCDRLVAPSGGQRTHQVLAGSELVELPEAGHDIPDIYRPDLVDKITALAAAADAGRPVASA